MRRGCSIIIFFLMMFIIGSTGCQSKIEEEPKVVFQDQTLQTVFDRMEYRESRDDFSFDTILPTQSQLNRMTALSLYFMQGEECSLKDLNNFPNLRGLLICNASQSVIQEVSEQKQLKALSIEVHEPVNLSSIGTMHNVKALAIRAPGEEAGKFDWSFIENMEQLETLYIERIELNDLNFLKSLPNLERLVINEVEIKDITALETLSNIKYFNIWDSNNDYSAVLENMNHLEQLAIREVKITNWSFLEDMKNLNWLSIHYMGNVKLPKWLLPQNYPYLTILTVDDDILNTNREMLEQIMPVLENRKKEKELETQFFDPRINFPVLLEYMEPIETYDD